jgi:hypothetical protein
MGLLLRHDHSLFVDPGRDLALADAVMARPTGVGRAISTYTIPIEGRDEWLAAARRLA